MGLEHACSSTLRTTNTTFVFFWGGEGAKNERKFIASVLDNFFTLCSSHLFQNDKKKFSRMQLIKSQIKIFIFKIT